MGMGSFYDGVIACRDEPWLELEMQADERARPNRLLSLSPAGAGLDGKACYTS